MPLKGKKSRVLVTTDKFCMLIFAVHWETTRKEAREIVKTILKWNKKKNWVPRLSVIL